MRPKQLYYLTAILLLAVLLAGCVKFGTASGIESNDLVVLDPVIKSKGDLLISVDPRIELLVAVQLQADYSLLSNQNSEYGRKMKAFLASIGIIPL